MMSLNGCESRFAERMLLIGVTALLAFGATIAFADEEARRAKLVRFVELWNIPSMVDRYRQSCLEPFNETTPERTFKQDPAYFQGITPDSPIWPKLVRAYWRYAEASCASLSAESVQRKHIDAWASRLNEQDLDGLLRFFQTQTGRRYVTGQHGVTDDLLGYYAEAAKITTKSAYEAYLRDLSEIFAEFDEIRGKAGSRGSGSK